MSEVNIYELYAIAAEAKCDYRTVRAALQGRRVLPAVKQSIDRAIARLKAAEPTVQP